jgi:predicted NUDIX family NTP pyrophosphohydrolase
MTKESAGLLLYQKQGDDLRVLLGHMGGPQYASKETGAWTIPKGKPEVGESLLEAAFREFEEEVGTRPEGKPWPLTSIVQRSGKRVHAWAMESQLDVGSLRSMEYELEWPPRSGKYQQYPELDRVAWLTIAQACELAIVGQAELFREVERKIG